MVTDTGPDTFVQSDPLADIVTVSVPRAAPVIVMVALVAAAVVGLPVTAAPAFPREAAV